VLADVRTRIERACARVGRSPSEVTLVAVTKGHDASEIRSVLLEHGHTALGENRVQEWRAKAEALPHAEWHFIGNLQTNKVKYLRDVHAIHSLGSTRLVDALERQGAKWEHRFRVFVEVNVAGEASKHGVPLEEAAEVVAYVRSLPHLELLGLMTMAPYSEDAEDARPTFRRLRELRDTLGVAELSMGMSGDFEVAVEEGATFVRVGSALFEGPPGER
jgi:PLP dependent protein